MTNKRVILLHVVLSLLFFAQALCVVSLTPEGQISFTLNHAKYSDDGTRVEMQKRELFDFNVVSLVYLFLLTSAGQHAAQSAVWLYNENARNHFNKFGVNWIRWCDYVLTAPVMMVVVGVMNAIFDVFTLLSLFGAVALTIVIGAISDAFITLAKSARAPNDSPPYEKQSKGTEAANPSSKKTEPYSAVTATLLILAWYIAIAGVVFYLESGTLQTYTTVVACVVTIYIPLAVWLTRDGMLSIEVPRTHENEGSSVEKSKYSKATTYARVLFFVATVPCVYAWVVIFVVFGYALRASEGQPPDFVYAINIVLLILFLGPFPYVHYASFTANSKDACETAHAALGLVSKSALAWMVYWGLRRMQDDVTIANRE